MKKVILLFCFFILVVSQSYSQTFDFYRTGPKTITFDTSFQSTAYFYFKLKNTSTTNQNFKLAKVVKILPAGWEASICCKLGCMAPFVDTVPPSNSPDKYSIIPGEVDSSVSIDLTPVAHIIGTAMIVLRAFPETNPTNFKQDTCILIIVNHIGINQISSVVKEYDLKQNYPNPFNPSTSIEFSLQKNSDVNLIIYDMQGREVARLLNNTKLSQGSYKYDFNSNEFNLSSGVYFYKLVTGDFISTKKMLLIK
ncbi:MAG: T9SS type A sorting domain-containing protein [Ignavibacteriae bacterium]|nr:T9SS type A sorting domain-containing protein [Ignavibacteriota bacterium]